MKLLLCFGCLLLTENFALQKCCAYQVALPSVGVDVQYEFLSKQPLFRIANDVPTAEALQGSVSFLDGKHLSVRAGEDLRFFSIQLILRSPGIIHLFDGLAISFDESMSVFQENGLLVESTMNSSVDASDSCDDFCDEYHYGWAFFPEGDLSLHQFEWNITPDLIAGVDLPETLAIDFFIWGAGPILVVPEPTVARLLTLSCLGILSTRMWRCHAKPQATP